MKRIFFVLTVLSVMFSTSCQKFETEKPLTFEVSVDATTVKVGEPVTFNFVGGDAHQISFYSGDVGNDYEYRDKNRIDQIKRVFFSFQTQNTPPGVNNLVSPDILVSTDFNGEYDYENVDKATWTPVSHLFTWGVSATPALWTPSGNQDISEYIEDGKPFYLAFRVTSEEAPQWAIARNWRTNGHSLMAETISDNYISMANYAGMQWKLVDKYLQSPEEISVESTSQVAASILVLGYYRTTAPLFREKGEVWGISKKFEFGDIDLGSENSVSLKQYIDRPLETYTHYYENPGVYKVVFMASNATISTGSQAIKELEITVLQE